MDLDRLSTGEKIVAGSGILLFILSFIPPWASVDVPQSAEAFGAADTSGNAWDLRFTTKLGILLALVAAVLCLIKAFGTKLSLPLPAGITYLVFAALAALFLLLEVILGLDTEGQAQLLKDQGIEVSRGIFLFVGLVLALAQTYGAWMHRSTEEPTPTTPASPPPAA